MTGLCWIQIQRINLSLLHFWLNQGSVSDTVNVVNLKIRDLQFLSIEKCTKLNQKEVSRSSKRRKHSALIFEIVLNSFEVRRRFP